jgi:hypothetical protein
MREPLDCHQMMRGLGEQKVRFRKTAFKERFDGFVADAAALFKDAVIHPALDLKKDRRLLTGAVIAETEFKPILISINGSPVELEIIRIQIKAMDWIRVVRAPDAELVHSQVAADKVSDVEGGFFRDQVFQLESLLLHSVFAHNESFLHYRPAAL